MLIWQTISNALLTTIDIMDKKELEWGTIQYLPVACYAYTVGENTIRHTKEKVGL